MYPTITLEATAFNAAQLIQPNTQQIALAGRSNVGKSSLVNALARRKQLAKTSNTPGKTRSINYYRIASYNGFLVDLPGYGYARCSQKERLFWASLIEHYMKNTPGLLAFALLIDTRLTPQALDKDLALYAQSLRLPLVPVLTKIDKCSKREIDQCKRSWTAILGDLPLFPISSAKKHGIETLWGTLLNYFTPPDVSSTTTSSASDTLLAIETTSQEE